MWVWVSTELPRSWEQGGWDKEDREAGPLFCEQRARGGRCAQRTRASGIKGRKGAGKEADLRAAGKRRPLRSEDAQGTAGCFGGALRVPLAYPPETAVLSTTRGGWLALVRCRAGAGWRTGAK